MDTQTTLSESIEHGEKRAGPAIVSQSLGGKNGEDAICDEVLCHFDRTDKVVSKACDQWLEDHKKARETVPVGNLVHTISSPEMIRRLVQFHVADIEEDIAILRARLARQRREEAAVHVRAGLGEHDGFFLEDGDEILAHRKEVRRVTRAHELERLKKLMRFSRDLAESKVGLTVEQIINGELPDYLKGHAVTEFTKDLGEYFLKYQEDAKALVCRICDEETFAKIVADDPQKPRPIRFLATIANELRIADSGKPEQLDRRVGFGPQ